MLIPPGCPTDARLLPADPARREAFLEMAQEFLPEGVSRWAEAVADFDAYFRRHELSPDPVRLRAGLVPSTGYWLVRSDGAIVGRSSLRHELNDWLLREGGHIGYAIRPSLRRQGYGTLILALTLQEALRRGLARVLVTCNADNTGSRRIIEKNGGLLENAVTSTNGGKLVLRFWIDIGATDPAPR